MKREYLCGGCGEIHNDEDYDPKTDRLLDDIKILYACCGPRMFWFNKHHPKAIYIDKRTLEPGEVQTHKFREVKPDILMDFRDLKFKDKHFKLVVWDPPHRSDFTENSLMAKNYGILDKENWREDLKKGFEECWRVLDDFGFLVFKWNNKQIKADVLLKLFDQEDCILFGHPTRSPATTHWFCFMKFPDLERK